MIRYVLLMLVELMGAMLALPMVVSMLYGEWQDAVIFAVIAGICAIVGYFFGQRRKPKRTVFYAREGFVITALAWIVLSMIGGLPFYISGTTETYIDAVFETVSGFTTTGSTILKDPSLVHFGMQFWRCFTHWVGGMGILVFMLAILPMTDGYSMHLMRAESPGPSVGKIAPKVNDTAKILYGIYIGFTVIEIVLLKISGLTLFESMTLTFSTVGTGGFGLVPASCGLYPLSSRIIITVFMALCGVNFSVYYFLLTKKFKEAWKCDEMRWYFVVMFGSATLIALDTIHAGLFTTFGGAFQHTIFTVSSIMTTTGFASIDYNGWPEFSRSLIIILTCIGACAGSTGGGFKFSRVIIALRNAKNEITRATHPKSVLKVNMDGHVVEEDTVRSTNAFLAIYVLIFLVSFLAIAFFESLRGLENNPFDFVTNLTAVAATLNNVGPGLNVVGPAGCFHDFTDASKLVMIFDMLAGRLEFLPILILFNRKTW